VYTIWYSTGTRYFIRIGPTVVSYTQQGVSFSGQVPVPGTVLVIVKVQDWCMTGWCKWNCTGRSGSKLVPSSIWLIIWKYNVAHVNQKASPALSRSESLNFWDKLTALWQLASKEVPNAFTEVYKSEYTTAWRRPYVWHVHHQVGPTEPGTYQVLVPVTSTQVHLLIIYQIYIIYYAF